MKTKLRYGIIGAGRMACGHVGCIAAIEDCEIVAAADPSEKSLHVFRHCVHTPSALRDIADLSGDPMASYRELQARPLPAEAITRGDIGNPDLIWCHEFRGPFLEKRENWILYQARTGGSPVTF